MFRLGFIPSSRLICYTEQLILYVVLIMIYGGRCAKAHTEYSVAFTLLTKQYVVMLLILADSYSVDFYVFFCSNFEKTIIIMSYYVSEEMFVCFCT